MWTRVVLQHCYSIEQMSAEEQAWKLRLQTEDPAVGYNDPQNQTTYHTTVTNGKRGGDPLVAQITNKSSPLYGMSVEERREYFRHAGQRSVAKKASS